MGGTLIYTNALFGSIDPNAWLGGELAAGKDKIINAPYNNFAPTNANATEAMNSLFDAIVANPGTVANPTDSVGWSMGGQAQMKLLRERGAELAAALGATNTVRFWITGCPESDYGASVKYPAQSPAAYPGGTYGVGYGLPASVPFETHVIANEFDGWADVPSDPANSELSKLVFIGLLLTQVWSHSMICLLKSTKGPHGSYPRGLSTPGTKSYADPARANVTYHWIPTYPVPQLGWLSGLKFLTAQLDRQRRPTMNAAYGWRPVVMDTPAYPTSGSWFS